MKRFEVTIICIFDLSSTDLLLQETVLEHKFESHVKKNVDEISESLSDIEVPEELNLAIDTMISDLETAAEESVETERQQEDELKVSWWLQNWWYLQLLIQTALHHLIEEEHDNVDDELKVLVDKTVDNLSKLEENHEGLTNEVSCFIHVFHLMDLKIVF